MYGIPEYSNMMSYTGYQQPMRGQYGMQYPSLNQMQQSQGQQMQQNQVQYLKGRPVSSYDEAKASMIDLDGSMFVFTDIANKRIYTKQILLDGSAELKTYVLEEQRKNNGSVDAKQNEENTDYVSRSEFDKVLKQINKRFDDVEGMRHVSNTDDE